MNEEGRKSIREKGLQRSKTNVLLSWKRLTRKQMRIRIGLRIAFKRHGVLESVTRSERKNAFFNPGPFIRSLRDQGRIRGHGNAFPAALLSLCPVLDERESF